MKTYLEVAEDVFRKGDETLQRKEQKKSLIKKGVAAGILAVLCIAVFGLLKQLPDVKNPMLTPGTTENAQTAETVPPHSERESASEMPDSTTTNDSTIATTPNRNSDENTTGTLIITSEPTAPAESDTEPNTQKEDEITVTEPTADDDPTMRSGAPSFNGLERVRAAVEENVCGWIRYNRAYYLQDDWSNGNAIEKCEPIGISSAVEGNLELLGLTGTVFLVTDDDNYSGCLLLRTDTGRNIVFIPVPDAMCRGGGDGRACG